MELIEMFCDLLLARFGLIQQMKTLDEGLAESISSLIWVAPRLQAECNELKIISDLLTIKYGKPYAQAARENALGTVSEKLMNKLSVQAPPKILVENYLIEIAKACGVNYEPDQSILGEQARKETELAEEAVAKGVPESPVLIDFGNPGGGGAAGGAVGGQPMNVTHSAGYPIGGQPMMPSPGLPMPPLPSKPPRVAGPDIPTDPSAIGFKPDDVNRNEPPLSSKPGDPNNGNGASGGGHFFMPSNGGFDSAPPPSYDSSVAAAGNRPTSSAPPSGLNLSNAQLRPTSVPRSNTRSPGMPELPDVPADSPSDGAKESPKDDEETIDFDDLARRFEALKKKK